VSTSHYGGSWDLTPSSVILLRFIGTDGTTLDRFATKQAKFPLIDEANNAGLISKSCGIDKWFQTKKQEFSVMSTQVYRDSKPKKSPTI